MKKLWFSFSLLSLLFAFTACTPDEDEPIPDSSDARKVVIGNEGAFNNENASLTLIDLDAHSVEHDVYSKSNDDLPLGDVLQSMERHGDELYLVVNNSAKIEVVDAHTFERNRTIAIDGSSPRYMAFLPDGRAYVSDLFANGLHIIDPSTGTYESLLDLGVWAEQMVVLDGLVYATCPTADSLLVIDPSEDEVIGGVGLSTGPDDLKVDADGRLWVMADGAWDGSAEPALQVIDPSTPEVIRTLSFPSGTGYNGIMCLSEDGDQVYCVAGGDIYRMDISEVALPAAPWIESDGRSFYGLNTDPETGEIFATHVPDFSQSGEVYVFDEQGETVRVYEAGIAPRTAVWIGE